MPRDNYLDIEEYDDRILVPREDENIPQIQNAPPFQISKKVKYSFYLGIALLIYFYYDNIVHYFLSILKQNPTIYKYYLLIESEILNNTLKGLFFISIMGSLFFLVLPSEAIFLYYLTSTTFHPSLIIVITILGTIVGLTFNYFFGWILGERILRFLFRKNFDKYKAKVEDYGVYVLVFGNILPGPIEVLAVFFGGFKFSYRWFILLSITGRIIKYLILLIAFAFFWSDITMYYNNVIDGFLTLFLLK